MSLFFFTDVRWLDEGGQSKKKHVTELMEQQQQTNRTSRFFQQQQQAAKKANAMLQAKNTPLESTSARFFSTTKREFEQPQPKAPSTDEFNVWSESPHHHQVPDFRPRSSRTFESSMQQFYYPRPELKPNYSTSTDGRYASNNNDLNFSINTNTSFYPLDRRQQQGYTSPTTADPNNNIFAPIGYSRQRSTSLLPTVGHHHNSQHMSEMNHHGVKQNTSYGIYPLYMPPTSRSGMSASNDYYMMNNHFPLDRKYCLERVFSIDSFFFFFSWKESIQLS